MARCVICHKPLSKLENILRGMGDVCAAKNQKVFTDLISTGVEEEYITTPPNRYGFIFERKEDGTICTNLPHLVIVHSPTGFEWGYGGSGPAETALNVLEYVVRREGLSKQKVKAWNGVFCMSLAWRWHQDFKRTFIANLSQDPGKEVIPYEDVLAWLTAQEKRQLEFPF